MSQNCPTLTCQRCKITLKSKQMNTKAHHLMQNTQDYYKNIKMNKRQTQKNNYNEKQNQFVIKWRTITARRSKRTTKIIKVRYSGTIQTQKMITTVCRAAQHPQMWFHVTFHKTALTILERLNRVSVLSARYQSLNAP